MDYFQEMMTIVPQEQVKLNLNLNLNCNLNLCLTMEIIQEITERSNMNINTIQTCRQMGVIAQMTAMQILSKI